VFFHFLGEFFTGKPEPKVSQGNELLHQAGLPWAKEIMMLWPIENFYQAGA
jgi:hypothetical protein